MAWDGLEAINVTLRVRPRRRNRRGVLRSPYGDNGARHADIRADIPSIERIQPDLERLSEGRASGIQITVVAFVCMLIVSMTVYGFGRPATEHIAAAPPGAQTTGAAPAPAQPVPQTGGTSAGRRQCLSHRRQPRLRTGLRSNRCRNRSSPASSTMTRRVEADYFTPSNSTSKISVAFGGITPPAPCAP